MSLTVSNSGVEVNGSNNAVVKPYKQPFLTGNCDTISVSLGTNHPDNIVSPNDGAVEITAAFTAAVVTPTLIYNNGTSTTNLNMNPVSGSNGLDWILVNFNGTEGTQDFRVAATGVNGEAIANASTELVSFTFDATGPSVDEMDVDGDQKIVTIIKFTEDLYAEYANGAASGALTVNDFTLTASSSTANLTVLHQPH